MLVANQTPVLPPKPVADNYQWEHTSRKRVDERAQYHQDLSKCSAFAWGGTKSLGDVESRLAASSLFSSYGHGSDGGGTVSLGGTSVLRAKRPQGTTGQIYLSDWKMPKGIVALWYHCCSDDTDPQWGCISQTTLDIGADASVGWHLGAPELWDDEDWQDRSVARWFYEWFWLGLRRDMTVTGAVQDAKEKIKVMIPGYEKIDRVKVRQKHAIVKILPAR